MSSLLPESSISQSTTEASLCVVMDPEIYTISHAEETPFQDSACSLVALTRLDVSCDPNISIPSDGYDATVPQYAAEGTENAGSGLASASSSRADTERTVGDRDLIIKVPRKHKVGSERKRASHV
jgi:hypothetical protein